MLDIPLIILPRWIYLIIAWQTICWLNRIVKCHHHQIFISSSEENEPSHTSPLLSCYLYYILILYGFGITLRHHIWSTESSEKHRQGTKLNFLSAKHLIMSRFYSSTAESYFIISDWISTEVCLRNIYLIFRGPQIGPIFLWKDPGYSAS